MGGEGGIGRVDQATLPIDSVPDVRSSCFPPDIAVGLSDLDGFGARYLTRRSGDLRGARGKSPALAQQGHPGDECDPFHAVGDEG